MLQLYICGASLNDVHFSTTFSLDRFHCRTPPRCLIRPPDVTFSQWAAAVCRTFEFSTSLLICISLLSPYVSITYPKKKSSSLLLLLTPHPPTPAPHTLLHIPPFHIFADGGLLHWYYNWHGPPVSAAYTLTWDHDNRFWEFKFDHHFISPNPYFAASSFSLFRVLIFLVIYIYIYMDDVYIPWGCFRLLKLDVVLANFTLNS